MKSLLICTCVVCGLFLFTENSGGNTTDSLFAVVKKSRGKEKIDAMNLLALHLFSSSIDSALFISRKALKQAQRIDYSKGICQALKNLGIAYYYSAESDSAVLFYTRALEIAKKIDDAYLTASLLSNIGATYSFIGKYDEALHYYYASMKADSISDNLQGVGSTYMNIGVVYMKKNQYPEAIEYFNKALRIASESGDIKSLSNAYHNLGLVYDHISDYKNAIENYLKALKIEEESHDKLGLSTTYSNIGTVFLDWGYYTKALEYFYKSLEIAQKSGQKSSVLYARLNLGYIYNYLGEYIKALEQYKKVNDLRMDEEDDPVLSTFYLNKGLTYKNMHQYDSATFYYQKALEIREDIGDKEQLARVYSNIGDLMYEMHWLDKAIDNLNISNTYTADYRTRAENFDLLSKIYEKKNDKNKAFEYFKKSVSMRDSVFSEEKHKQINELQIQYETAKKEQQIESLEKINEAKAKQLKLTRLIFGLAIAAVLIIILLGAMFFHNRQLRSKHRMLLTEQKLLRSQMNPHFIFNSLSAIQSYILKNKALEAGSYLSRFAKLMRSILENSSKELITLEEEIETLTNYLDLQKIRLQEKLEYSIRADDGLLEEEISVPPMLSQPFIENAIEHGILKKESEEGAIDIHFIDKQDQIIIKIIDNGIGREKAGRVGEKKHRSRATEITQSRIALLSKAYKIKPAFETIDLYDKNNKPEGTKVLISLPKLFL
ncbi:MAG: tetratricopeptide repeat protein [Bacteroidales bacterium]|nr:tetratricopeptide repeat protein [Bacteroidales bacterium]